MYGYWFGMHLGWWVFWLFVVVAFFVFLTPVPRASARGRDDPLSILKRRYAAGEISTAEFEERRARLLDDGWRGRGSAARPFPPPPPAREVGPEERVDRH